MTTVLPPVLGDTLLERVTLSSFLNIYLREIALVQPGVHLIACPLAEWPAAVILQAALPPGAQPIQIHLPRTGMALFGALRSASPSGHHQFEPELWMCSAIGGQARQISSARELAPFLLDELAADAATPATAARRAALLAAIENSLAKTARYLAAAREQSRPPITIGGSASALAAEQGLLFGHPFHPTPKSSEGFADAELASYAPELGARFQLDYLAAAPALIAEDFLPGARAAVIPPAVAEEARRQLGAAREQWALLPCHPWQAQHLRQQAAVQDLLAANRLMFLGALGEPVVPTSSVRTVLDPAHACFFKLPLDVRITNFVRINTLEHVRRSMDASRALAAISAALQWPHFRVLRELGYRTILPGPGSDGERLPASVAVLFREQPWAPDAAPLVLAAVLEPAATSARPALIQALDQAAGGHALSAELVIRWLRRYLDLALLPILELFLERGVSLEAHVQNTLVAFERGWPHAVYVRDLEGVSISRELAETGGWYDAALDGQSPALYPEAVAWHRLKYYVIVNHLSHLLATLGHHTPASEARLWQEVRRWLVAQPALARTPRSRHYLSDLLEIPTLPAKANLLSCLQERSETPLYAPLPNPLTLSDEV